MLKDLILEFSQKFYQRKREKNIMDFSDMEHLALKILVKKDENGNIVKSEIAKKYENDTIKCIPKQEIYHFEQSYQYVILCCEDDYYNLLMNYRIHRDMLDVQVYSLIGKQKYEELYQENIELLQTIEDIERLIKHLYDQKKNKC